MGTPDRDRLFHDLEKQGLLKDGPAVRQNVIYHPPQGKIIRHKYSDPGILAYEPSDPTPQTDLLQNIERQHILPTAVQLAMLFKVPPITDDVYRFTTEEMKDESLFFILSRSNIKKVGDGFLVWDPILVVIKRSMVVRIRCFYQPSSKAFGLKEVHLWQNATNSYYIINDPKVGFVNLPGIIDKYVRMEGIFSHY